MKIRYNGKEAMCHIGNTCIVKKHQNGTMGLEIARAWLRNDTNEVFCLCNDEEKMNMIKEGALMERSTDWKERLYAEYWQTKIRLKKLKAYINKRVDGFSKAKEPIEIFLMQENYMQGYLRCLEVRARYNGVDLGDKGNEGKQKAGQGMA